MRVYSYDTVSRLIERIYDAALDPTHWSVFLDDLAGVINGHGLNLSFVNASNGDVLYGVHSRSDPTFVEEYRRYYSTIDPWVTAGRRRHLLRPGLIALGEPIVPPSVLKRTEFYHDFGRYYQFCGGISALFAVEGSLMAVSGSQYKFGQFDQSEARLLRALVPHLERAMKIHQRLEGVGLTLAVSRSALDQLNYGILFLSASGRVLFANQAGRELLASGDGLHMSRGELRAATPAHSNRLREAIAIALRTQEGTLTPDRPAVAIERPSARKPLSVLVTPLPRRATITGLDAAAVALFITDPERSSLPAIETIRATLRLTPSEAHLAQRLASGQSVKEAAEDLSIRLETARKRLKVIFQKTDTHRQSDLVRLILMCTTIGGSLG